VKLIHKLEPLWWLLFGAGGFIAAFFLPGLIIGVLLLAPLGVIESGLRYERALALASSPVGRGFLIVVLSLTLWHCAHHLRHLGLDLGMKPALPAYVSYLLAIAGTAATVVLVTGL
jgi:fumarate reductase subunit D